MKQLSILLLVISTLILQAQEILEKEIKTQIDEVTVFINGAQINRQKDIELNKGISLLKFESLSPFIDDKSIQLKANGDLNVLSVSFQKNFLTQAKKSEQMESFEQKLKVLDDQIRLEKTYLEVLKEELDFLKENRDIGGKNTELMLSNLKATADYYAEKITSIKLKEIERNEKLEKLYKQRNDLQNQINTLSTLIDFPTGEIWVKVEAKTTHQAYFSLDYLVGNAGWFPSYDVRAKSIDQPLEVVYKANVHQDTKVDWTNVKMSFSSSNPKSGGTAPELLPYYLSYNSVPPVYNKKFNSVSGYVVDEKNKPISGATISIQGTTIGTTSGFDGGYTLAIPANGGILECSSIGMKTMQRRIDNPYIKFRLESDNHFFYQNEVIEVTPITAQSITPEIRIRGISSMNKNENASALPPPSVQVENQTSFAFELEKKYSLKSDNKTQTVVMQEISLPASFQYFCIPKIDPDAFLMAYATDWEKLNLLEGEANIFFEDTYIGKTLLDVRLAGDTLNISLGRDKNVQVKREKQKDYSSKQFFGNKKEESKAWNITVKNNKKQAINMVLYDQIPVPTLEEIELQINQISGAKHNKETGELKWELQLTPLESKLFEIKYTLKYPKGHNLILD